MHKIETEVEGGSGIHEVPKGARVDFWLDKGLDKRKVSIKYLSDPYYDEGSPVVEVLLPNGKQVIVTIDSLTIKQN